MRPSFAARTALVAGLLLPVLAGMAPAETATPATPAPPVSPAQLRDRIVQGIADGLARENRHATAPTTVATSHPAPLRARARAHAADSTRRIVPTVLAPPAPPDTTTEGIWNELLAGNQRYAAGHPREQAGARTHAADSATVPPRAVVLACSDSDASPDQVFDQSPGGLFVVRTSGNMVDPVALGSLEFAVTRQHARVLVVLGHDGCGAVRAAAGTDDMGSAYMQAIVDRIRPVVQRLSACFEGEELIERVVIASARQSAQDVLANSALLRHAAASGQLKVVCAVYDHRTGAITPVSVPAAPAQALAPAR